MKFNSIFFPQDLNKKCVKLCLNGGICVNGLNGNSSCFCLYGFSGDNCGQKFDPCLTRNCSGNGYCMNNMNTLALCVCKRKLFKTYIESVLKQVINYNKL